MRFGRRIKSNRDGTYAVKLNDDERRIIGDLLATLDEVVETRSDIGWRLFPNAHPDDEELAAEYAELVGDDLVNGRKQAITTMRETLDREELNSDQLTAWMATINDLRLVIGTRLDVTEESDPSDFSTEADQYLYAVYVFLSVILEEIIEAF